MDDMKALDEGAFEYLNAIDPRQWCKAFFEDLSKCDLLLNNICEVFNKYILDARELPVVTGLKKIKDQLMLRFFSKRKELGEMCGSICPKIRKKLDNNINFANNYEALPAAEDLFKVTGLYGEYEVHIGKMECSCRAWQLSGIPCRHACAAFRHERIKPETCVHKCYSLDAFKSSYSEVIMPCSDPRVWKKMNGPEIKPPKYDKKVGRPSKKRKKCPLEEEDGIRISRHGIIGHCSVCNQTGHNKRKCPERERSNQPTGEQAGQPEPEQEGQPEPEQEGQHEPIHVVYPDDEEQQQPPKKMPVKRKCSAKKQIMPHTGTSATASILASAMSYDITTSTVMQVLQDQAVATQMSQTSPPGPLPESQFILSCIADLPPPRAGTKTLGLSRQRKKLASTKKKN